MSAHRYFAEADGAMDKLAAMIGELQAKVRDLETEIDSPENSVNSRLSALEACAARAGWSTVDNPPAQVDKADAEDGGGDVENTPMNRNKVFGWFLAVGGAPIDATGMSHAVQLLFRHGTPALRAALLEAARAGEDR